MKPAPFRYARPDTLVDAVALLAGGGEAKLLAGGQSLVPMMNMRLVRPVTLVDLNAVRQLDGIAPTPDGGLAIGAMTRHADLATSVLVRERAPMLAAAARHIGHPAIRNRGTLGGSLAHADPAAELPAALLALDATVTVEGPRGTRTIPATDLFRGLFATALAADEILTAVRVPPQPPGWGFAELARRAGDFALAGVAVAIQTSADNCARARIVAFGAADRPVRLTACEVALAGGALDADTAARAAGAIGPEVDPPDDVHASSAYRRHLVAVLAERALLVAFARAAPAPE